MRRKPKLVQSYLTKELQINAGKNIFSPEFDASVMKFKITPKLLEELKNISLNYKHQVLEDLVDKVIKELCKVNQYYYFGSKEKKELKLIYASLLDRLIENEKNFQEKFHEIRNNHVENLRSWLRKTNPFAEELYSVDQEMTVATTCAEYSGVFQMKLFKLNPQEISSPVLDIGCGENAHLVSIFRSKGLEAYGIDRYKPTKPWIVESDWLIHNYGLERWGTIISNLGFSNHFHHHHLRGDGQYEDYAKCYMRILNSLKPGGTFYYAPDLPFIESYLDFSKYSLEHISIPDLVIKASKITKL